MEKEKYYDSDKLKIADKEFTFILADPRMKNIIKEFRNLGIPFGCYGAHVVNKKSLYDLSCIVKEYFNSCCFRSKSSQRLQQIKSVEIVEKGMAVYFWCNNMNNFVVCAGTKKQTYKRLQQMFIYISLHEHDDHINLSEFTVR